MDITQAIQELENTLKGIQCQWVIKDHVTKVRFTGKLKRVSLDTFFDRLIIQIGTAKNGTRLSIAQPVEIKKEDDIKKLKYTFLSDGKEIIIGGYVKSTQ